MRGTCSMGTMQQKLDRLNGVHPRLSLDIGSNGLRSVDRRVLRRRRRIVVISHRPADFAPDDHLRRVVADDRLCRFIPDLIRVQLLTVRFSTRVDRVVTGGFSMPFAIDVFEVTVGCDGRFGTSLFERSETITATVTPTLQSIGSVSGLR